MRVENFQQLEGVDRNALERLEIIAGIGPAVQQHRHRSLGNADGNGLAGVGRVGDAEGTDRGEMRRQIGAVRHLARDAHLEDGKIAADRQAAGHHPVPHAATAHHAMAHATPLAALHHALGHLRQHAPERQAAQGEFRALGTPAEVGPDIQTLARSQHHIGPMLGDFQQAAIDTDHRDGRAVAPAELVDAGRGTVHDPQAVGSAGHLQFEVGPAIDQNPVAVIANHAVMHGRAVDQLVAGIEAAILDHDRNLVLARGQAEPGLLGIVDDQATGQAVIHLGGRRLVGMRVIDVQAGPVQHLELVDPRLTLADGMHGMPVHVGRHMQAMPVGDAGLGQLVVEVDADLLALLQADERAQIAVRQLGQGIAGAAHQLGGIAEDAGRLAGQDGQRFHPRQQVDFHIGPEIRVGLVGRGTALHGPDPGGRGGSGQQAPSRAAHEATPGILKVCAHALPP